MIQRWHVWWRPEGVREDIDVNGRWVLYADHEAEVRRLREALRLLQKYSPLSGDMALMIRGCQSGGIEAAERADKLVDFYKHLDEAHDAARAALEEK